MQKSFTILEELHQRQAQGLLNTKSRAQLCAGLYRSDGYRYIQQLAAEILSEFTSKPGEDKWQTYSTISYAYERLFSRIMVEARKEDKQKAATPTSILTEIQNNARRNGTGNQDSTSRSTY